MGQVIEVSLSLSLTPRCAQQLRDEWNSRLPKVWGQRRGTLRIAPQQPVARETWGIRSGRRSCGRDSITVQWSAPHLIPFRTARATPALMWFGALDTIPRPPRPPRYRWLLFCRVSGNLGRPMGLASLFCSSSFFFFFLATWERFGVGIELWLKANDWRVLWAWSERVFKEYGNSITGLMWLNYAWLYRWIEFRSIYVCYFSWPSWFSQSSGKSILRIESINLKDERLCSVPGSMNYFGQRKLQQSKDRLALLHTFTGGARCFHNLRVCRNVRSIPGLMQLAHDPSRNVSVRYFKVELWE